MGFRSATTRSLPPVGEQAFHLLMLLVLTVPFISVLTWCSWRLPGKPRCLVGPHWVIHVGDRKTWSYLFQTLTDGYPEMMGLENDNSVQSNMSNWIPGWSCISVEFRYFSGVVHPSIFARPTNCIQEYYLHMKVPCDFSRCSSMVEPMHWFADSCRVFGAESFVYIYINNFQISTRIFAHECICTCIYIYIHIRI